MLCLREASLGPVFGIKGGAAGGGYAQVVPMEDLNLHFTGDIHAIGAANNLLAAMIEAQLLHGNALGIDPLTVGWRRCVDVNDRALRTTVVGLGGRANGYPRETGFDITAASEVMAIVAVARDLHDLRARLGAITVGYTYEGEPVLAEQLRAAGAMSVLLKDAIKPNLVQTLEGQPALVHCGPFANIAHGNNSLVADRVALKLGDYVVTESGFGSDMGMEKFLNIVCRVGDVSPSAVVLVATAKALKHHGGDPEGGLDAIERGSANLERHLEEHRAGSASRPSLPSTASPATRTRRSQLVRRLALEHGAHAAELNEAFERGRRGRRGARGGGRRRRRAARTRSAYTYALDEPIDAKIEALVRQVYRADGAVFLQTAKDKIGPLHARRARPAADLHGEDAPLALARSRARRTRPTGFEVTVRDIRAYTGAGLARRALRDDADDARARRRARRVQRRHRRRRAHGWALLASSTRASRSFSTPSRRGRPRLGAARSRPSPSLWPPG